jgi:hypothetical protein
MLHDLVASIVAWGFPMIFRAVVAVAAVLAAAPACAWSGSATAGDYRFTATLSDGDSRLQQVAVGGASAPMTLRAWYVDSEGAILGNAALASPSGKGTTQVAFAKGSAVPTRAAALVVLAQPAGLTRTASAAAPAVVAQIALP